MKNKLQIKDLRHKLSWLLCLVAFLVIGQHLHADVYVQVKKVNSSWSSCYVYLYSGSYWDKTNGSGAKDIKWCNNNEAMSYYNFGTDGDNLGEIYYKKISGQTRSSNYISFTKDAQCGYGNFYNTEAIYRGDFSADNKLYTPNTTSNETKNGTKYYNSNGSWGDPIFAIKHKWNNQSWNWKKLTKQSDGTYTVNAKYGGTGCNYFNYGESYVASPTLIGTLQTGDDCTFVYDPSNNSITIKKACTDPTISQQPSTTNRVYYKDEASPAALSVTASGDDLSYKWMQCATVDGTYTDVTTGSGYDTNTFTPSTAAGGKLYYKCYVSNSCGNVTSNASGAYSVSTDYAMGGWLNGASVPSYAEGINMKEYTANDDSQTHIWSAAAYFTASQGGYQYVWIFEDNNNFFSSSNNSDIYIDYGKNATVSFNDNDTNKGKVAVKSTDLNDLYVYLYVPSTKKFYYNYPRIVGDGSWSATGTAMNSDKTNHIRYSNKTIPAGQSKSYKITNGIEYRDKPNSGGMDWSYSDYKAAKSKLCAGVTVTGDKDNNLVITNSLSSDVTATIKFDAKQDVYVEACANPIKYNLSVSPASVCAGATVTFTLSGSQKGVTYQLKKGDTAVGTGVAGTGNQLQFQLSSVAASDAGSYTVVATDDAYETTTTTDDEVTLTVKSGATAAQYTMASGQTATYDGEAHLPTVNVATGAGNITKYYGSTDSGTNWTDYGTAGPVNAGTYKIKVDVEAGDTYCAAEGIVLDNTFEITQATPTASQYTINIPASPSYTGSPISVTIAPKSGAGTVSKIYYEGADGTTYAKSETAPTHPGKYTVTFDVNAGTNYGSASGLSAGTLTITKANQSAVTAGTISGTLCGAGDYTLTAPTGGSGTGAYSYKVSYGDATVDEYTLTVITPGTIKVQAKRAGDDDYNESDWSAEKSFVFAASPTSGFDISATSSSLTFSNTAYVSTTLSTTANANYDFSWECTANPTYGTYNTPTFVSQSSNSTEVRFPIEGTYTFRCGAKCKNSDEWVYSKSVDVTVSLPMAIKGPILKSDGSWGSYTSLGSKSDSNTRNYAFKAYNTGSWAREFCLDATSDGSGDNHHIHNKSSSDNNYLALTNLEYYNSYNLRENGTLNISSSGTDVVLTITHEGGLYYTINIQLDCSTPVAKTIEISSQTACSGNSVNVVVKSSQSGYIYNVYDGSSTGVATAPGTGSDLSIPVTPTGLTTYTVKAQQSALCAESAMSNTVSVTSYLQSPTLSPSTGLTQYKPITITGTNSSVWSITTNPGGKGYLSASSGLSVVFKAPYNATAYVVTDSSTGCTVSIPITEDSEDCN